MGHYLLDTQQYEIAKNTGSCSTACYVNKKKLTIGAKQLPNKEDNKNIRQKKVCKKDNDEVFFCFLKKTTYKAKTYKIIHAKTLIINNIFVQRCIDELSETTKQKITFLIE